ncbi:LysM peptidoglycan-binding domain-containing protein [Paenibacillus gansuensis]|uniref:LysM peptidoglycan-binding domain-containing protein n=1 Tax=Paenibacillus gansuensis TaxID=306542 RepID=A0ABW5PAL4_9BACL
MQAYYTYTNTTSASSANARKSLSTHGIRPKEAAFRINGKRFMVFLLLFVFCSSFGIILQANGEREDISPQQVSVVNPAPAIIYVDTGESLWSIAQDHASDGQSVRSYIASIKKLNGLHSSLLQEGQALKLPAASK